LTNSTSKTLDEADANITATLIIPTRNRASLLRECLAGVFSQTHDLRSLQIIVVDNGDDDGHTRQVVEAFKTHGDIAWVTSSPPGLSRARNVGLGLARGDITIFIDDDEVPKENWLSELLKPFALQDPTVDIVAGDYEPEWETPRPEWLEDRYLGYYSAGANWSEVPRVMKPSEWVLEGNVAIRTHLLTDKGGFDERLGRAGSSLISCEGAIYQELRQEGAVAYFNPNAVVSHLIHADRLNKGWLTRRLFAQGVSKSIMAEATGQGLPFPEHVSVKLSALLAQDPDSLDGEDLLVFIQIFEILGFICHKQNVL